MMLSEGFFISYTSDASDFFIDGRGRGSVPGCCSGLGCLKNIISMSFRTFRVFGMLFYFIFLFAVLKKSNISLHMFVISLLNASMAPVPAQVICYVILFCFSSVLCLSLLINLYSLL